MMKSSNLNDFHCTWTFLTKLKELKELLVFLVAYMQQKLSHNIRIQELVGTCMW